jgi:hypothetical protein
VDTVAVRELPELGAARETVCKHGRTFAGLAHRGQQFVFRHRDADLVMSPLGPEVSGEAAAAADDRRLGSGARKQCPIDVGAQRRGQYSPADNKGTVTDW